MLPWQFSWVPGTAIPAPDATSRQPQPQPADEAFPIALAAIMTEEENKTDLAGDMEYAAVARRRAGELQAVTWERVQEETKGDANMSALVDAVSRGFNEAMLERLPQNLASDGGQRRRHDG